MEKILKEGHLEIKFDKEDLGFVNLIVEKLLASDKIKYAACNYDHPVTKNPVLKAEGKELDKELKKAIDSIIEDINEFQKCLSS